MSLSSAELRALSLGRPLRSTPFTSRVVPGFVALLKSVTMGEKITLNKAAEVGGETDRAMLIALYMIKCVFDESGQTPVYVATDRDALVAMDAEQAEELWVAISELNGFTPKAAEQAEKN